MNALPGLAAAVVRHELDAQNGHGKVIEALVGEHEADVDQVQATNEKGGKIGRTALHWAAAMGQKSSIDALLGGARGAQGSPPRLHAPSACRLDARWRVRRSSACVGDRRRRQGLPPRRALTACSSSPCMECRRGRVLTARVVFDLSVCLSWVTGLRARMRALGARWRVGYE